MLSSEQIKTTSSILGDLGQVAIASAVVPFVIPDFRPEAMATIMFGSLLALLFWVLSILAVKSL